MARKNRSQEIKCGILSAAVAAGMIGVSAETIKRMCKKGLIHAANVSTSPSRKEWRIAATAFKKYCLARSLPIHRDLSVAVENYNKNFETESQVRE